MKDIETLFKEYRKIVPLKGEACPRQYFLGEVGRYLWNGWGKTIPEAAQRLVNQEREWKKDAGHRWPY
jgi:hypothetical protein